MSNTLNSGVVEIYVKLIEGKKVDGTNFTAYETVDKNKNRLSVRFVENCTPSKPTSSCYISLKNFGTDYWVDKRKAYPILRIRNFEVLDTPVHKVDENPFI